MKTIFTGLASLAMLVCMTAETSGAAGAGENTPAKKSIVPAKYSGKYKGDNKEVVAEFIKEQSSGKEGFEFTAFFSLCRKNGIEEAKVAHYEALVADKANNHGIEGRARMTLGNMLRAKARKNGKLVGLNDEETAFDIPKPAVSGAAAAAVAASGETAATSDTASETTASAETTDAAETSTETQESGSDTE